MSSNYLYNAPIPYDADQSYDAYSPARSCKEVQIPITHLALPLALAPNGTFLVNQQDSLAEVEQSVEVIVGSVQNSRTVVPTFGMPIQNFQAPSKGEYLQTINKWDNRAAVTVTVRPNDFGQANVRVSVALARGSS